MQSSHAKFSCKVIMQSYHANLMLISPCISAKNETLKGFRFLKNIFLPLPSGKG